ncbi:hypothetical protein HPB48_020677 [Haemaphysalis longicornis]|uniref:Uncharacterized protein n=1 Tax=Haemaphysalis longicornis TaxID=44386 RepID=A0A9J6GIY0_HAELO|nr:hypothetical protein HPB48_020677 [Haemaphysalis longicornis]
MFMVRYLGHSNQLAVDAADPEVRDALLAIASLPVSGKDVSFQAYQAVGRNQITGIIRNVEDMTSDELINSLHCRKCKILQARPLGDKGTVMVTFEGKSLPYKVGLGSFTIRFFFVPGGEWLSVIYVTKLAITRSSAPILWQHDCPKCGLPARAHNVRAHNRSAALWWFTLGHSHKLPQKTTKPEKLNKNTSRLPKSQRRKRQTQGRQRRNPEAEQGLSRPMLKATRQSSTPGHRYAQLHIQRENHLRGCR